MRTRTAMLVMGVLVGIGVAQAAGTDWLETGSADGKRNWFMPEGWTVAKGVDEEVGDILIYEAPEGGGDYIVQGLAKSRDETCPAVVQRYTKGKKGKAQKGVYCAEAKDGDFAIAACAREDKEGYIIVLVLRVKSKLMQGLGGATKLRELVRKTYGIAHTTT